MVEFGSREPPSFPELVRKTHTRKDGSFVDHRAEEIIQKLEEEATELTTQDGSPNGFSQTASSAPKNHMKNLSFAKHAQTSKGTIYGIGRVQYREKTTTESIPISLQRNLDMDMRIRSLEDNFNIVNDNVSSLKTDVEAMQNGVRGEMSVTREALNAILKKLGLPEQPQPQSSTTPAAQTPASSPAPASAPSSAATPSSADWDQQGVGF